MIGRFLKVLLCIFVPFTADALMLARRQWLEIGAAARIILGTREAQASDSESPPLFRRARAKLIDASPVYVLLACEPSFLFTVLHLQLLLHTRVLRLFSPANLLES